MSDDVHQVVRNEETVVAGQPPQTVVSETTTAPLAPAAVSVAPVASTVQTIQTTPSDQVVAHKVAYSDINPAAERAANVGWVNSAVWLLAGLLIALLAIRFLLALTGADPHVGFAALIYGLTTPFRAPFAGLFGAPITYEGVVTAGRLEFEDLVAMVIYALIAWGITKLLALMLGTNRTRTTVVSDTDRRTQL
jgi:hypothetical protein